MYKPNRGAGSRLIAMEPTKKRKASYVTVVHNHEGQLINGAFAAIIVVSSALAAVACTMRRACRPTVDMGYQAVVLEPNSKVLMDSLMQGPNAIIWDIKVIQQDIWQYAMQLSNVRYRFTKRFCNSASITHAGYAIQTRHSSTLLDYISSNAADANNTQRD